MYPQVRTHPCFYPSPTLPPHPPKWVLGGYGASANGILQGLSRVVYRVQTPWDNRS